MRAIVGVLLASLVWACAPQDANSDESNAFTDALVAPDTLQAVLRERSENAGVASTALAYRGPGGVITTAYVGEGVGEQSLFQAASLSKAVAAAGILTLAEHEGIGLDEDIRAHVTTLDWERLRAGDRPVTLRQLLSHTSGSTVPGFMGYRRSAKRPSSIAVVEGARSTNSPGVRFNRPPGAFAYSGGGYQVAQVFAEELSGQPFDALMRELVLEPVGMTSSTFAQPIDPDAIAPRAIATPTAPFARLRVCFGRSATAGGCIPNKPPRACGPRPWTISGSPQRSWMQQRAKTLPASRPA